MCQIAAFFVGVCINSSPLFLFVFIFGAGFLFKTIDFQKLLLVFCETMAWFVVWTTPWNTMGMHVEQKNGISTTEPV